MKNVLIGIHAIVLASLLIVLVFVPLLVVKGIQTVITHAIPKLPKDKPKWVDTTTTAMCKFYMKYLSF